MKKLNSVARFGLILLALMALGSSAFAGLGPPPPMDDLTFNQ